MKVVECHHLPQDSTSTDTNKVSELGITTRMKEELSSYTCILMMTVKWRRKWDLSDDETSQSDRNVKRKMTDRNRKRSDWLEYDYTMGYDYTMVAGIAQKKEDWCEKKMLPLPVNHPLGFHRKDHVNENANVIRMKLLPNSFDNPAPS